MGADDQRRHRQGGDLGSTRASSTATSTRAFDVIGRHDLAPALRRARGRARGRPGGDRDVRGRPAGQGLRRPRQGDLRQRTRSGGRVHRRRRGRSPASTATRSPAFHAERYRPPVIVDRRRRLARPRADRRGSPRAALRPAPAAAARPGRRPTAARRVRAAHRLPRERHRAVPRLRRRAPGSPATTSAASRCAVLEGVLGGHVLLAAVPGGRASAAARPTPSSPTPTCTTTTGEVGLYLGTRPENLEQALYVVGRRARALRCRTRPATQELIALAGEPQGARRARARVHRRADEPARRLGHDTTCRSSRSADVIDRIDAVDDRRCARARRRAVRRRSGCRSPGVGPTRRQFAAAIEPLRAPRTAARGAGAVIRVAVSGAAGRMGEAVCTAVERGSPDWRSSSSGRSVTRNTILADALGAETGCARRLQRSRAQPSRMQKQAVSAGVHVVIGTTGFDLS